MRCTTPSSARCRRRKRWRPTCSTFRSSLATTMSQNAFWWLHLVAQAAANEELGLTLPYLSPTRRG